jgi:hypothetical protein
MSETAQFIVPNDGTVIPESSYGLLPDNTKVQVTILPTNKGGNVIVKRPYAKQGDNAKLTALAIRVSIDEGQRGARRNLFQDIALTRKFASGKANLNFAAFFRALGHNVDAAEGFAVPDDRALIGEKFEAVVGVDDSGDEPRNIIKFINKANGVVATQATRASENRPAAAPAWTPGAQAASAPPPHMAQYAAGGFVPPPAAGFTPPPAQGGDVWAVTGEEAHAAVAAYSVADGGQAQGQNF